MRGVLRTVRALYCGGGLVVSTPYEHGIGIQTLIQPDGDLLIRVLLAVLEQPTLWHLHMVQVEPTLATLSWCRRGVAWSAPLLATSGMLLVGGLMQYQALGTLPHQLVSMAASFLGTHFLIKALLRRAVRALVSRVQGTENHG